MLYIVDVIKTFQTFNDMDYTQHLITCHENILETFIYI